MPGSRQGLPSTLVLATANPSKLAEVGRILAGRVDRLLSLSDLGFEPPEETGTTYSQNARIKAVACWEASGFPSLADDSGLEVRALGGRPGVFSARYAPDARARITKLLDELRHQLAPAKRGARFVCLVALARPGAPVVTFRGQVAGRIALEPAGTGGFGFDPVFLLPRLARTMAQLSDEEKDRLSHRGRALAKFVAWLDRTRSL